MSKPILLLQDVTRNRCQACNVIIHPKFSGYHRCGYLKCPGCRIAVDYSNYMNHITSHGRPRLYGTGQETNNSLASKSKIDIHEKARQTAIKKQSLSQSSRWKCDYLGRAIVKEQERPDVGSYW